MNVAQSRPNWGSCLLHFHSFTLLPVTKKPYLKLHCSLRRELPPPSSDQAEACFLSKLNHSFSSDSFRLVLLEMSSLAIHLAQSSCFSDSRRLAPVKLATTRNTCFLLSTRCRLNGLLNRKRLASFRCYNARDESKVNCYLHSVCWSSCSIGVCAFIWVVMCGFIREMDRTGRCCSVGTCHGSGRRSPSPPLLVD